MENLIDNPTPGKSDDGAPKPAEAEKHTLKVVATDPVTGESVHKQVQVTVDEAIALAQKGYRFEDKMAKLNTLIDQKSDQKVSERLPVEAEKRAKELFADLQAEANSRPSEISLEEVDTSMMSDGEKALYSGLNSVMGELNALKKERNDEKKARDNMATLKDDLNEQANKALTLYPRVKPEDLKNLVLTTNAKPDKIVELAGILDKLSSKDVKIDDLDSKSKNRLEKKIREKLEAPTAGPEGDVTRKPTVKVAENRQELLDKALDALDEYEDKQN